MARKKREWFPGAMYHIMHRGVRRKELIELAEFSRRTLDVLRQPIEDKKVSVVILQVAKRIANIRLTSLAVGHDTKGGQSVLNGVDGMNEDCISPEKKKEIYRTLAQAQLDAWNAGSGYFYWSYKLLTDTVNTPGWVGWDCWVLGRCVDFGWFPTEE